MVLAHVAYAEQARSQAHKLVDHAADTEAGCDGAEAILRKALVLQQKSLLQDFAAKAKESSLAAERRQLVTSVKLRMVQEVKQSAASGYEELARLMYEEQVVKAGVLHKASSPTGVQAKHNNEAEVHPAEWFCDDDKFIGAMGSLVQAKHACKVGERERLRWALQNLTAEEMAKYAPLALRGLPVERLRSEGFGLGQLCTIGFEVPQLRSAYSLTELRAAGFSMGQLREGGYTLVDLIANGCTLSMLSRDFTVLELRQEYSLAQIAAQFTPKEMRKGGLTARECRSVGISAAQLGSAGFDLSECRQAGCACAEMRALGHSAHEMRAAGYIERMRSAGYSFEEAEAAGYTLAELIRAGYTPCPNGGQHEWCARAHSSLRGALFSAPHTH